MPLALILMIAVALPTAFAAGTNPSPASQRELPAFLPEDLTLAVIPRPREESTSGRAFEAGSVAILADDAKALGLGWADLQTALGPSDKLTVLESLPEDTRAFDTLVAIGGNAWRQLRERFPSLPAPSATALAEQRYELRTLGGGGQSPNFILLQGGSTAAEYYGIQTLRQMTLRQGRTSLVREASVSDWPSFAVRGNKRFVGWMAQFKANLANASKLFVSTQNALPLLYGFREFHPISYPPRPPFDVMRVASTVENMVRITPAPGEMRAPHPVVGLLMDDVEVTDAVSSEDRAKYGGYFQAINAAVEQSAAAVHAKNPAARMFFMPQFYFSHNRDFAEGGRIFREAGPFPQGAGIYFNGAEVSSLFFPREMVRDYLRNLGAPDGTPVLIYDTIFDTDQDFFAVPRIDPDIAGFIEGFVPESGNPVNMGTYYDMLWNPEAYDRARSGMLACRELMGFEHWQPLYRAGLASQAIVEVPPPGTPREAVLARLRENIAKYRESVAELSKLTEFDLTGRVDLSLLFERGHARFFGPFELGDVVVMNRPFRGDELVRLQAEGPDFLPADSVIARVVFDNEAYPKLPGGPSWRARYVGSVNTGAGPGGRPAARFPGFAGTGILAKLDQPLPRTDTWSVAFWMRATDPERTVVPFSWYKKSDMVDRTAIVTTPGIQPGSSRQNFDRLRTGESELPGLGNCADGRWQHIALEFEADGTIRTYLDGALAGSVVAKKPSYLEGDTLVLGAYPAPAKDLAGLRLVLRNWGELVGILQEHADALGKQQDALQKHYAATLAAPSVAVADDAALDAAPVSTFPPQARVPLTGDMTLCAVHDAKDILFRIRGRVPPQGFMPAVQIYLDPTSDRSGALQINIPQTSKDEDPVRDFVQEGVGAQGDWAAWFARDLRSGQYKDLPVDLKWGRRVADGFYEVEVRISKQSLQQAAGGAPLSCHLGLQVYQWIAPWSSALTWRGRIDPATFGTLELLPP